MRPAVCILFFEKIDQTLECVNSFLPSGVDIYVLNNNSSVSARRALGEHCRNHGQVRIFDAERNLGVSAGRNLLVERTSEEWLFFVDNDIRMATPDWLPRILRHLAARPDIEALVPRLYNQHEHCWQEFANLSAERRMLTLLPVEGGGLNQFPGGAAVVRRGLFQRLGSYDERIFVGAEDVELCLRGVLSGRPVKARLVDDIELIHEHRQARSAEDRSAVRRRYDLREIGHSYAIIEEKHGVRSSRGWRKWVSRQLHQLLFGGERRETTAEALLRGVKRWLRRLCLAKPR